MSEGEQEQKPGNPSELLLSGASAILSLFPLTAPIGAMGSFGLLAWQNDQLKKFIHEVQQKLRTLDQTKLDHDALNSDEFKALAFQVIEATSKSASESKLQVLANVLLKSVTFPNSQFSSKQTIIRLITQMSDEEMVTLAALAKIEDAVPPNDKKKLSGIPTDEIAQQLHWSEAETVATCEGLLQLGLVLDSMAGALGHFGNQHYNWATTTLARRLISFSSVYVQTS